MKPLRLVSPPVSSHTTRSLLSFAHAVSHNQTLNCLRSTGSAQEPSEVTIALRPTGKGNKRAFRSSLMRLLSWTSPRSIARRGVIPDTRELTIHSALNRHRHRYYVRYVFHIADDVSNQFRLLTTLSFGPSHIRRLPRNADRKALAAVLSRCLAFIGSLHRT